MVWFMYSASYSSRRTGSDGAAHRSHFGIDTLTCKQNNNIRLDVPESTDTQSFGRRLARHS